MTTQQKQGNIVAIVMMIFLFAMISFVTNLAAPMGVIVKSQFLEGMANASSLGMLGNFANFLAYLFMGIPAGLLLQKFGGKKTALAAIVVGFAGIGIQFLSGVAGSFEVYLLGAFVAGFCVCMLNTVVNPMLNTLGYEQAISKGKSDKDAKKEANRLLQIGGTFNSLAGTLTPMLVGVLIGEAAKAAIKDVNPLLFAAMGVFALTFIVLSLVTIPELHKKEKKTEKDQHSAWNFRHFVLGAIGIFIYVGVEVGIPATLMLFLADSAGGAGLDPATAVATAGFVAGTYWLLMLVGRFTGSAIGDKVSSKTMLTVASAVGILLILAAIFTPQTPILMPVFTGSAFIGAQVPISALFLVLVGLCTSVMWGGIFNLAVDGLGKYTAAASGIFMMMVVGGGVLPLLQNFIADQTGSYMISYWVPVAGLAYLLFYALAGSKNVNTNIDVK